MRTNIELQNQRYFIRFAIGSRDEKKQIKRSLGTSNKKEAQRYQILLEDLWNAHLIDPFADDFEIDRALKLAETKASNMYLTLDEAIKLYLATKANLKTIKKYEIELKAFGNWRNLKNLAVNMISSDLVDQYIWRDTNEKGLKLSKSTQSYYWRTLNPFFKFLAKKKYIDRNPLDDVEKPKSSPTSKSVISSDNDLEAIFKAFDKYHEDQENKSSNYRLWQKQLWFKPLILLYNATGCRRSQPLECKWSDLESDFSGIWVSGVKFERSDKVYYYIKHEEARLALAGLKRLVSPKNDDFIFSNTKNGNPLTGAHVYKVFKKFAQLAGVNPNIHIHGLRHKSVTDDLNSGVPIHMVSKQHQHSSIAITEKIYAHLDHKFVKEGYDAVYGKGKKK